MSICVASAWIAASLAGSAFTLSWTHSVERVEWREHWVVTSDRRLRLDRAQVRGSGAGMEPPDGAVLRDGWWIWQPTLPAQTALHLAVSGATVDGWRVCTDRDRCHDIESIVGGAQRIDRLQLDASGTCRPLPPR